MLAHNFLGKMKDTEEMSVRAGMAFYIVKTYVEEDSERMVGVTSSVREKILKEYKNAPKDCKNASTFNNPFISD